MPKYMTKDQIAEYEYLTKEKANGRLLTAEGIEFICAANNYDAEAIGKYFLELLPQIKNTKRGE
jgi:hypothetical protein